MKIGFMNITTIRNWIFQFLQVQLFLTVISLPILLAWGLPISLATIIGNLIFTPFISVFLLSSTLIFFSELLHIPNQWLIVIFEQLNTLWLWALSFGSSSWMIGYIKPHWLLLITMPIIASITLYHRKISTSQQRVVALSIMFTLYICTIVFVTPYKDKLITIPCGKHHVQIVHINHQTILIDQGNLARIANIQDWIEYSLKPHLLANFGTTTINHWIVLQPRKRSFDAIQQALQTLMIENSYIPRWKGNADKKFLCSYFEMKKKCCEKQCSLIILDDSLHNSGISIQQNSQNIKYGRITYPDFAVIINNVLLHSIEHDKIDKDSMSSKIHSTNNLRS